MGGHSGGTDLDDDAWEVRQHRMRDIADEADHGRADQETPEEANGPAVFLRRDLCLGVIVRRSPL
jgi:hypothetical protein